MIISSRFGERFSSSNFTVLESKPIVWLCNSMKGRLRSGTKRLVECSEDDDVKTENIYREDNHIYFHTEIDRSSIFKLNTLLRETEEYCVITAFRMRIDPIPIYLHLYSNGGCIHSALAAVDAIQNCRTPVHSIIEGATASAGTMISMVCTKRFIRPNAYMLIHQLSSAAWGKMSEIIDEYQNLADLMKRIRSMYLTHTRLTSKKLDQLLNHDLWLDATKCMEYGLVDEIYK